MGLYEARGTLAESWKVLQYKWQRARLRWTDANAERFEREVVQNLERDLRAAGDAIDSINVVVSQAKRDCR